MSKVGLNASISNIYVLHVSVNWVQLKINSWIAWLNILYVFSLTTIQLVIMITNVIVGLWYTDVCFLYFT